MRKLLGLVLLACALLGLVSMTLGMKGRLAGMKVADKIPFAIGMLIGVGLFLVPAWFLLRIPPLEADDPVPADEEVDG